MATTEQWHNEVTESIGGSENYGRGIWPNPWIDKMAEYSRRKENSEIIHAITHKIAMLSEPRFHTGTETSELMQALITMISARQILELGTHTGRSTLHFLRAVVGIAGAKIVSIDARPTHDREFFAQPGIGEHFEFIEGWTPDALKQLHGRQFDFVFIDSAHDLTHTQKELEGLAPITHRGTLMCFHDVPEWQTPGHRTEPPVRIYLRELIERGVFSGMMLPSPAQLDCEEEYGKGYDNRCNPGLAVLIRK